MTEHQPPPYDQSWVLDPAAGSSTQNAPRPWYTKKWLTVPAGVLVLAFTVAVGIGLAVGGDDEPSPHARGAGRDHRRD